jgi:nucleotide-binding universal stress UspA family protein
LEALLARLTGKSVDLLCYEDVRGKLDGTRTPRRELREIELDRIVGSVGRCTDFTRSFLPRQDSDARRWARTELKMGDLAGLPPIEVYELGGVYFVHEGHHRVSVARQSGGTHLQAYVTKVEARVSLPPDAEPEDVIVQAEYNEFLERTRLDELRPESDLSVSVPGQYRKLLEHIEVHRYFMGLDEDRFIPYEEAVPHWYDHVYVPVADVIRAQGILQDFPERTEADLYLWVAEYRNELREKLGWDVDTATAAGDLAEQFGDERQPFLTRLGEVLRRTVVPRELGGGPPPGAWREERLAGRREERLFRDVLVVIDGRASGWRALQQVRVLSQFEHVRAHGLYVVLAGADPEDGGAVNQAFTKRLERMGLAGELTIRSGQVASEVADLARWTDLVVLGLDSAPDGEGSAKVSSGVRSIISRSPRPLLLVTVDPSPLDRAVLAYDGSPKAEEALFVAAYVAGRWGVELTVVTARELGGPQPETLKRACDYLDRHGVEAVAVAAKGPPAEAIMRNVESAQAGLIIMGGYGFSPVLEIVLGSTVDRVLREGSVPVLVCR